MVDAPKRFVGAGSSSQILMPANTVAEESHHASRVYGRKPAGKCEARPYNMKTKLQLCELLSVK